MSSVSLFRRTMAAAVAATILVIGLTAFLLVRCTVTDRWKAYPGCRVEWGWRHPSMNYPWPTFFAMGPLKGAPGLHAVKGGGDDPWAYGYWSWADWAWVVYAD